MEANKPAPPQRIEDILNEGVQGWFDEKTQTFIVKQPDGKWVFKTPGVKADTGAELQTQVDETTIKLAEIEELRQIGSLQQRLQAEGLSKEKALAEAKSRIEDDPAVQASILANARIDAQQTVARLQQRFRPAQGSPSPDEKMQMQEAGEQQQAQQEAAQQEQKVAQEKQMFVQSINGLRDVVERRGLGDNPSRWSNEDYWATLDHAHSLIQTLPAAFQFIPSLTSEEKKHVRELVELAQAIVNETRPGSGQ
jgi:hypothetical protein